jgi:hypothetical protein
MTNGNVEPNPIVTNDDTSPANYMATSSMEAPNTLPYKATQHTNQQGTQAIPKYPNGIIRPQYDRFDNNNYYKSYKKRKGIDGAIIHILVASIQPPQQPIPVINTASTLPINANIFSPFIDLPYETTDPLLYAFPVVDNKADTLTQSQMLKDADVDKFHQAQASELQGLQKLKVFDIKHISIKPTHARLLS